MFRQNKTNKVHTHLLSGVKYLRDIIFRFSIYLKHILTFERRFHAAFQYSFTS